MPIVRKLTTVGEARGITLPKSWILYTEELAGRKIVAIALEIDRVITLEPIFEKTKEKVTA